MSRSTKRLISLCLFCAFMLGIIFLFVNNQDRIVTAIDTALTGGNKNVECEVCPDLQSELDHVIKQLIEKEEAIQLKESTIKGLEESLSVVLTDLENAEITIQEYSQKITQYSQEIVQLKSEKAVLEEELAQLQLDYELLQQCLEEEALRYELLVKELELYAITKDVYDNMAVSDSILNSCLTYADDFYSIDNNESLTGIRGDIPSNFRIPDCVTIIHGDVFTYLNGLYSVVLPSSLSMLNAQLANVLYVRLPSSLGVISGIGLFPQLQSLVIPVGVHAIDTMAFLDANSLSYVRVERDNAYYTSCNESGFELNCIMTADRTKLIYAPNNFTWEYLPDTVTDLGIYAGRV